MTVTRNEILTSLASRRESTRKRQPFLVGRTIAAYLVLPRMTIAHDLLRMKLAESLATEPPALTRRDVVLPAVPGKAFAVIGVRRGGKTSFLAQCRADRLALGRSRESQLLFSLEDERLAGLTVADLGWLIEEHARQFPEVRAAGGMTFYLDEVQTVPGWEGLVRRLMDEGGVELFVSGSSAKLLSREVATSLRGRAMEVLVHPFSFREALRHAGAEPTEPLERLGATKRAALDQRLRRYLAEGGFPEAQGASAGDRAALLSSYVDVVVLRDVIERHAVSNPLALRWIERQLLANPGGSFSVKKHYDTLRSQGVAVGKDTLHNYLAYLEDAFLVRTVAMHSASERQRMVNPRKAYPVDPGLIALFERSGRTHHGRALETAVLLELERRGYEVAYVRTPEGFEVDFLAHRAGDAPLLLQVCLESEGDDTWERELRALEAAAAAHPDARPLIVSLDALPPRRPLPGGLAWAPAACWLLEEMSSNAGSSSMSPSRPTPSTRRRRERSCTRIPEASTHADEADHSQLQALRRGRDRARRPRGLRRSEQLGENLGLARARPVGHRRQAMGRGGGRAPPSEPRRSRPATDLACP